MTYNLEFEIPGLPKMANPSGAKSTHWRYIKAERDRWLGFVMSAIGKSKPAEPLARVRLILTRFSSVEPDYDGLVRGFKDTVDGLKNAGVIANDRLRNTGQWDCRWEKCKPRQGKIRVHVREVTCELA